MPNTACENGNLSTLFKLLSDQLPYTNLSAIQRRYFNEAKGISSFFCWPFFSNRLKFVKFNVLVDFENE